MSGYASPLVPGAVHLTGRWAVHHAFKHELYVRRSSRVEGGNVAELIDAATALSELDAGSDPAVYSIAVLEVSDPVELQARALAAGRRIEITRSERRHGYRISGEAVLVELWHEGGIEPDWRNTGVTIGHALRGLADYLGPATAATDHLGPEPTR